MNSDNKLGLLIIFILLFCCGCTAKYKIEFYGENISEELTVTFNRDNITDEDIEEFYSESFYAIGRENFYNFDNSKSTKKEIKLNLNYDFNVMNIKKSNMINTCIEHFDFFEEEEKYYITASGALKCTIFEYVNLDSLDIVITTNHNVIDNNADEVKDNAYIWHIDERNYDNVSILFTTDKKENRQLQKKQYMDILITAGIVSVVALITVMTIAIKHKQVNKL